MARLASVLAVGTVVLTAMPIFFAGNAIYPIVIMTEWLQAVSNPLTDQLDAPRAHMLTGGTSNRLWFAGPRERVPDRNCGRHVPPDDDLKSGNHA